MSTDPSMAARRADRRQGDRRLVVAPIVTDEERREAERRSGRDRRLSPRVSLEG